MACTGFALLLGLPQTQQGPCRLGRDRGYHRGVGLVGGARRWLQGSWLSVAMAVIDVIVVEISSLPLCHLLVPTASSPVRSEVCVCVVPEVSAYLSSSCQELSTTL